MGSGVGYCVFVLFYFRGLLGGYPPPPLTAPCIVHSTHIFEIGWVEEWGGGDRGPAHLFIMKADFILAGGLPDGMFFWV